MQSCLWHSWYHLCSNHTEFLLVATQFPISGFAVYAVPSFQKLFPLHLCSWVAPIHPFCYIYLLYCSVTKSRLSLWPHGLQHARFPCPHRLPEFAQTHVHWVDDAIQPSHFLLSPSPPVFNLSQWGSFPMSWLFVSFIYMSSQLRSPQLHLKYVNWFSLKIYMFFNSVPHLFPS